MDIEISKGHAILDQDYAKFLADIKTKIRLAHTRAALSVSSELVLLYWHIGNDILKRQDEQGWGAKVITRLLHDLSREFPQMKGFSSRNLKYMRGFAVAYPDEAFVQEMFAQITWYHNISLLRQESYDQPSVGILLCKTQNRIVVEYALHDMDKPMSASTYQLMHALPENLKSSLLSIEELEAELGGVHQEEIGNE